MRKLSLVNQRYTIVDNDNSIVIYDNNSDPVSAFLFGIFVKKLSNDDIEKIKNFTELYKNDDRIVYVLPKVLEKNNDLVQSLEYYAQSEWTEEFSRYQIEILIRFYVLIFPIISLLNDNLSHDLFDDGFYGGWDDKYLFYLPYQSSSNLRDFIIEVFGSYRRDIAHNIHNVPMKNFPVYYGFRKLLTIEFFVQMMSKYRNKKMKPNIRIVDFSKLSNISHKTVERLFEEFYNNDLENFGLIDDALDFVGRVENKKIFKGIKNWNDLHDEAYINLPEMIADKTIINNVPRIIDSFDNIVLGSRIFQLLRTRFDFVVTGRILDNCLGRMGYFEKSIKGLSYCFKILQNNDVVGALEVGYDYIEGTWKVLQLRAAHNELFSDEKKLQKNIDKILTIRKWECNYE